MNTDTSKKWSLKGNEPHFNVAVELDKTATVMPAADEQLRRKRIFLSGTDDEAKIAVSAYKNLRTRVLLRLDEIRANSVMVTGAVQNVGKTLTAINLALALSRRTNRRVVLVDLDLRSPSVHHLFGFESKGNILDVAEGRKRLSEVVVDVAGSGLKILPGSDRIEDSSEAIVTEQMKQLFSEFKRCKDTIFVFDTPPVLGCDDVAAVSPLMYACLFVVSERSTTKKELTMSLQFIGDSVPIVGIAMNRSSEGNFESYYY